MDKVCKKLWEDYIFDILNPAFGDIEINPFKENGDMKSLTEIMEELQNKISELPNKI